MNAIAYLRVSTEEQGRSGLGIDAQRRAVEGFCAARGWHILSEHVEIETGRRDHLRNRPKLTSALAQAKRMGATLVVARLDRLSRSVLVTAQLIATNVDFVAVDAPFANRLTVQLAALMAEYESRLISERTKDGMAAARARGVSFARHHWSFSPEVRLKAAQGARRANRERARAAYADIAPEAVALREAGKNWTEICRYMNAHGHVTRSGGPWGIHTVKRLVNREGDFESERRKLVLKSFKAVVGHRTPPIATQPLQQRPNVRQTPMIEFATAPVLPGRAVIYCRVSTKMQFERGYSLEAQQKTAVQFCKENNLTVLETYTEVERAWKTGLEQRPQLREAIAHAGAASAKLIISRLDRLARNVSVVSGLLRSGVSFIAADAPFASEFTILLLSAIAQEESRLQSVRTTQMRAAAKASGKVWKHVSNFRRDIHPEMVRLSAELRRRWTRERYAYIEPIAKELRESGLSLKKVAMRLNDMGLRTQRGTCWTDVSTQELLRRIGAAPAHRSAADRGWSAAAQHPSQRGEWARDSGGPMPSPPFASNKVGEALEMN